MPLCWQQLSVSKPEWTMPSTPKEPRVNKVMMRLTVSYGICTTDLCFRDRSNIRRVRFFIVNVGFVSVSVVVIVLSLRQFLMPSFRSRHFAANLMLIHR